MIATDFAVKCIVTAAVRDSESPRMLSFVYGLYLIVCSI